MKIKSKKFGISKSPPPQRRDQILCTISRCENLQNISDNDKYFLSYDKTDLCNNYISKEQGSADWFSINFLKYCVLGHVLPDAILLDEVDSRKEVVQPTKRKPRSVDPGKLKSRQTLKKTTNNKKS